MNALCNTKENFYPIIIIKHLWRLGKNEVLPPAISTLLIQEIKQNVSVYFNLVYQKIINVTKGLVTIAP